MDETLNHEEAEELANLNREKSNLARCYLDMKAQRDFYKQESNRLQTREAGRQWRGVETSVKPAPPGVD